MRKGSRFLFIVGFGWLAMALVGMGIVGGMVLNQHGTSDWTPVGGVITDSEVIRLPSNKGHPTYSARITYAYRVGDKEYRTHRTSMAPALTSTDPERAAADAAALPAGRKVTVYYDPNDPGEAVLDRGLRPRDFSVLVFLTPFLLVGLLVLSLAAGAHMCRGPGHIGTRHVTECAPGVHRVRTNTILAGSWGFIAALLVSVAGLIVLLAFVGDRVSQALLVGYYGALVLVGLGAWLLVRGARQRGRGDIVIDEAARQITVPRGRGWDAQDYAFAQVVDTRLIQDSSMTQNRVRGWRVHLALAGNDKTRPVVDIASRREASAFNDWLRERLALGPAARLAADSE